MMGILILATRAYGPGDSDGELSIFGVSCKSSDPRSPNCNSFGSGSLIEGSTSHRLECPWKDFRGAHSPLALEFRPYTMHNPWAFHWFSIQLILLFLPFTINFPQSFAALNQSIFPHNSGVLGYSIHTSPNIYSWLPLGMQQHFLYERWEKLHSALC